jgi:TorA maturation chaperone TorD
LTVFKNLSPMEQIEALTGEALLYGLLGRLLYQEPDREWISSLFREGVFTESPFGSEQPAVVRGLKRTQEWGKLESGLLPETLFKDLQADYFALFVGISRVLASPWESVYFNSERLVFQKQTLEVRGWYRRFGLQVEKLNQEPDDHIGLQLAFLAQLTSLSLNALEAGNLEQVEALQSAKAEFLEEHLLRWEGQWYESVQQHARTDFFRGISDLLHGALRASAELLEISRPLEVDG